jgi:putative membrane protein
MNPPDAEARPAPKRSLKDYLYVSFCGICMGAADIVPGVSGGTMALILGIYEELLDAIKSVNFKLAGLVLRFKVKEVLAIFPWAFLLALGVGLVVAVAGLTHIVDHALHHHKLLLFAFFFGLIIASVISLGAKFAWNARSIIGLLCGTVVGFTVAGMLKHPTPDTTWMIVVSGMIGICAMILPGISGSFLLLLMGKYSTVIGALKSLLSGDLSALSIVIPFGIGALIGIMSFSRVVSWTLNRWHNVTLAVMTGFIVGSLRKIWPFKGDVLQTIEKVHSDGAIEVLEIRANALPDFASKEFLIALGLAILGFVLITLLDHLHEKKNPIICMFRKG